MWNMQVQIILAGVLEVLGEHVFLLVYMSLQEIPEGWEGRFGF